MRALLVLCLLPLPALAETQAGTCPGPDPAAEAAEAPLFEALRSAPGEAEGREMAEGIERSWHIAPDARAQSLLDGGKREIGDGDHAEAERLLSELVAYCPDYAEGWNQRALARSLAGDLDAALADLEQALVLEPRHFGALAGRAAVLMKQGRAELGQLALRAAVEVNPWLPERHLLVQPPGPRV